MSLGLQVVTSIVCISYLWLRNIYLKIHSQPAGWFRLLLPGSGDSWQPVPAVEALAFSACFTFTDVLLAQRSHVAKPRLTVGGRTHRTNTVTGKATSQVSSSSSSANAIMLNTHLRYVLIFIYLCWVSVATHRLSEVVCCMPDF